MAKFSEFINGETPVLVDFHTEWWRPCRSMSPVLYELKSRIGQQAKIIMLNLDKNPKAASVYDVKELPTLMLFKKGKIIWRQSGMLTADQLQEVINRNIHNEL